MTISRQSSNYFLERKEELAREALRLALDDDAGDVPLLIALRDLVNERIDEEPELTNDALVVTLARLTVELARAQDGSGVELTDFGFDLCILTAQVTTMLSAALHGTPAEDVPMIEGTAPPGTDNEKA